MYLLTKAKTAYPEPIASTTPHHFSAWKLSGNPAYVHVCTNETIDGVETTIPLFHELVRHPDVVNGMYDIHWLEKYLGKS